MNINRHNYEAFFVLYVDNELSTVERSAVEDFVQENPDLNEEFMLFQQTTLHVEETYTIDKKNLYRNEQSIGLSNYEQYFLLHVDDELKNNEKEEVEKFVLHHPELQNEFTLLHKSKLQPELVEFKEKSLLYRKETSTRIIPMAWMRIAAAAAVTGIIVIMWSTFSDNTTELKTPVALIEKKNPAKVTDTKPAILGNQKISAQPKENVSVSVDEMASTKKSSNTKNEISPIITKDKTPITEEAAVGNKPETKQPTITSKENLNNLPTPDNNPVYAERNSAIEIDKSIKASDPFPVEKLASNNRATLASNSAKESNKSLVKHAVYTQIDTELDEESQTLYIGGAEINKNKLRGLVKKASTFINKRINKPAIEKSIHIAGFEIKSK